MKIKSIEDRLLYLPTRDTGEALFQGEFECDADLIENIGLEAIEHIKNKIQSFLECRKEMFGVKHVSHYGLHEWQRFYDLRNRIMLEIHDAMDSEKNIITIRKSATGNRYKKMSNIGVYNSIKGITN